MKLFATRNSPFSRIARIVVQELNIPLEVEFVTVRDPQSTLLQYGPLGKVPALYFQKQLLNETRLIVRALERIAGQQRFSAPEDDLDALAFESFCLGFLDGIAVWIREARREPSLISEHILEVEKQRAIRCVQSLSEKLEFFDGSLTLANLAVACALALAKQRLQFTEFEKHPELLAWLQAIWQRESFVNTEPVAVKWQA